MIVQHDWIEKQGDFCKFCMDTHILEEELRRYRCIETMPVEHEGGDIVGELFPVCCMYRYGYNKFRGKTATYSLFANYMRLAELKACRDIFKESEYLLASTMIVKVMETYPNLLVYLPIPAKSTWNKFRRFHLGHFINLLEQYGIPYTDNLSSIEPKGRDLCIVVFEVLSSRERIGKIIHDIAERLVEYKTQILYISLLNEVDKKGKPIYFTPKELL